MNPIKSTIAILSLFLLGYCDSTTLRAGINNFTGFADAAVHNPHGGARLGSASVRAGSSWC